MKIYKYTLAVDDEQAVVMPQGSKILSAQVQRESICLWALVDEGAYGRETRTIRIHGTGHDVPNSDNLEFIDTVQLVGGELIFHVFEVIR